MASNEPRGLLPHQRASDVTLHSNNRESSPNHVESVTPESEADTVLLNKLQDIYSEAAEDSKVKPNDAMTPVSSGLEPKHCWICLQDEGEEDSNSGSSQHIWKSPCQCNLQAHEECLLEWIADLEAPSSKAGAPPTKILCPQCKTEIHVARPQDYLVSAIDYITRKARLAVVPFGLSTVFGILYTGSMVHGVNSINLVFGMEEAQKIWRQGLQSTHVPKYLEKMFRLSDPFLFVVPSWKILIGVPAIAPALILARTSLADNAYTALPVLYFAMHRDGSFLRQWPPSPGLAFSLLPYMRSLYREIYRRAFGELEKQWDQAVQRKPREGETAEQVAAAEREAMGDDIINIEIDLEVEGGEDFDDMPALAPAEVDINNVQPIVQAAQNADAGDRPAVEGEPGQPPIIIGEPQVPRAGQPQDQAQQGQLARVDNALGREGISINKVAQSVLGALFMPAISGLMGDVLKYTLPSRLVTKSTMSYWGSQKAVTNGLLQERWGRSLVGGLIFIVIKDALSLYSKWRKAKNHGKRRVLDYVNSPSVRARR